MGEKSVLVDARRKNWFWDYNNIFDSELTSHAKLVRLYLARCADNNTRQAWPSLNNIAKHCGISRATVKRAVNELVESGWLIKEVRKEDGAYTSNLYILCSPDERIEGKNKGGGVTQTLPCNELTGVGSEGTYGKVTGNQGVGSEGAPNNTNILTRPNEQYFIKDQVTNDSLRSSLVTHGSAINQNPISETQDTILDSDHDLANAISKRPPVEKKPGLNQELLFIDSDATLTRPPVEEKTDHDLDQLSFKTGDNNKVTVQDKLNMEQVELLTDGDVEEKPSVEREPELKPEQLFTDTGVNNKKLSVERKPDIEQGNLSLEKGVNNTSPAKKEPELNQGQAFTKTGGKKEPNRDQETGYTGITNADLIALLGDSLREAWDGPPAKAYAIAGRLYNLYDYPAAEASVNIFCRRIEDGFKPKNPVAYLMKVAREKKKDFESVSDEPQFGEKYEYFSERYPEEHSRRVEEAKKVSAEHEHYLKNFSVDRSPPSVPGFKTPGESLESTTT